MRSQSFLVLPVLFLLNACGGGSSTGNLAQPLPPVTPLPSTDANALAQTVAVPTYANDSGNVIVYNGINALRAKLGSGLLTQSINLDQAAQAHWQYLDTNTIASLHSETQGKPGFTGTDATARAKVAGYSSAYVDEVIFGTNGADNFSGCVASWANSVYHIGVLFSGVRDIGIAAFTTKDDPVFGKYTVCVADFSVTSSKSEQLPDEGTVRVYPYPEQTGVPVVFYNQAETPTPLPEYPELGAPVTLNFKTKSFVTAGAKPEIVVSQLSIITENGQALSSKILANLSSGTVSTTAPALQNDDKLAAFTLTAVPLARLLPKTVYTVSFAGSVNGKSISKTWKFTTAAN